MAVYDLIAVLDGAHETAPVPDLQMVVHHGLTAVLGATPRPLIRLPQTRRDALAEVATRLRWQEACMTLGTLLPLQPGTALTLDAAAAMLAANRPDLTDTIARFAGHVQSQVTVSWAEDRVLAHFRHSPELAPIFASKTVDPAGLRLAVTNLALRLSTAIGAHLALVATDIAPLPAPAGILWNGAVLLPRSALSSLDRAVEAIDALWSEGLTIRQIGPAPISSFATLHIEPVTRRQIDWALDRFNLTRGCTQADVHRARRQALVSLGPDSHGAERDAIRTQARIAEAAERLAQAGFNRVAGLALCNLWSEGQSAPVALPTCAVA